MIKEIICSVLAGLMIGFTPVVQAEIENNQKRAQGGNPLILVSESTSFDARFMDTSTYAQIGLCECSDEDLSISD